MNLRLIVNATAQDIRDLCHLLSMSASEARQHVASLDPATLGRYRQVVSEIETALAGRSSHQCQ